MKNPVQALRDRSRQLQTDSENLEGIDVPQCRNLHVMSIVFDQAADYLESLGYNRGMWYRKP